jgi:DNA-binding XRE family transcriptional regulator
VTPLSLTKSDIGRTSLKAKTGANGSIARRAVVKGERVVILPEPEYERLLAKADEWEPLLPEPDPDGNYPALEYCRVSLARKIIRDRRRLGLSQAELARRAGIRPESLNRIETGRVSPSLRSVEKIDRVLKKAEALETKRNARARK